MVVVVVVVVGTVVATVTGVVAGFWGVATVDDVTGTVVVVVVGFVVGAMDGGTVVAALSGTLYDGSTLYFGFLRSRSAGGGSSGLARLASCSGNSATTDVSFRGSFDVVRVRVPSAEMSSFSTWPLAVACRTTTPPTWGSTSARSVGLLSSTFCWTISPEGSVTATFIESPCAERLLADPEAVATRFPEARVRDTVGSVVLTESPVRRTRVPAPPEDWTRAIPDGRRAKMLAVPGNESFDGASTPDVPDDAGMLTT